MVWFVKLCYFEVESAEWVEDHSVCEEVFLQFKFLVAEAAHVRAEGEGVE